MYKIKNTEIEELKNTIENKDLAPTVEYLNYKLNGEPLCFYERTAEWQALYSTLNTFFDYYQDETNKIDESKITYRNGICSFKDIILNYTKSQLKDRLPEDAAPYTSFTHILIKKYSSDSVRIYENTTNKVLKDTIQADRLVILLQAAGGGGGGTSNVYAAT